MTDHGSNSLAYFQRMGSPIVATATASGGPIGILRISGRDLSFLEKLVGPLPAPQTFQFRPVKDSESGEALDHALVLFFKNPHSYTGEDVVELQLHGVPKLLARINDLIVSAGARHALPGEFSFRAVINGKMTLAKAEALQMALGTEGLDASWASKLLGIQKSGSSGVEKSLAEVLQTLSTARGRIEAAIDFPEAESEQAEEVAGALTMLSYVHKALAGLLSSYENFCISAGEPRVAIVGQPNVGKSTLLNILCGGQRALVSPVAGTTRDIVEGKLCLSDGRWIKLFDTAGLREISSFEPMSHDGIEQAGIELGLDAAETAAVIIYVEKSGEIAPDPYIAEQLKRFGTKPILKIRSYGDFSGEVGAYDFKGQSGVVRTRVVDELVRIFRTGFLPANFDLVISARQGQLLRAAVAEVRDAEEALRGMRPMELAGLSLRTTEELLRKALGQQVSNEYIGEIFRQFCLGK